MIGNSLWLLRRGGCVRRSIQEMKVQELVGDTYRYVTC